MTYKETSKGTSKTSKTNGITLIEVVCASVVVVIGLLAVAGVMSLVSQQREQSAAKRLVLGQMQTIFEEMRSLSPEWLSSTYNGRTYTIPGATGTNPDGSAVVASVDATNPDLLIVTLTGSWHVAGQDETLSMATRFYNPKGTQCP
jgi:Tfp pilus assembly protein PilV